MKNFYPKRKKSDTFYLMIALVILVTMLGIVYFYQWGNTQKEVIENKKKTELEEQFRNNKIKITKNNFRQLVPTLKEQLSDEYWYNDWLYQDPPIFKFGSGTIRYESEEKHFENKVIVEMPFDSSKFFYLLSDEDYSLSERIEGEVIFSDCIVAR